MKNSIHVSRKPAIQYSLFAPLLMLLLASFTIPSSKNVLLNEATEKANKVNEESFGIYGGVFDYKTSKPVKGVKVVLKETGAFAITDDKGYFEIVTTAKNIKEKRTLTLTYNDVTKTAWSPSSSYSTANIDNLLGEVRTYFIDTELPGIVSRFSSMGELKTKESLGKNYILKEFDNAIKRKDEAILEYDVKKNFTN